MLSSCWLQEAGTRTEPSKAGKPARGTEGSSGNNIPERHWRLQEGSTGAAAAAAAAAARAERRLLPAGVSRGPAGGATAAGATAGAWEAAVREATAGATAKLSIN
jgi:hypothetical protein